MVFSASIVLMASPPASFALLPPLPSCPWHAAHFAAYMRAPSAAVPLPGGRPVPSGRTLMSHPETSASLIGFPSFGPWAKAALQQRAAPITITHAERLSVDMLHLPTALDRPACDRVEMLAWIRGN